MSSADHVSNRCTGCPLCAQGCLRGASVCWLFLEWNGMGPTEDKETKRAAMCPRFHHCQVENLGLRSRSTNPRTHTCQPWPARRPTSCLVLPDLLSLVSGWEASTKIFKAQLGRCLLSKPSLAAMGGRASAGLSGQSQGLNQLCYPSSTQHRLSKERSRVKGCIACQPPPYCCSPAIWVPLLQFSPSLALLYVFCAHHTI